jgi:hypothetical protein
MVPEKLSFVLSHETLPIHQVTNVDAIVERNFPKYPNLPLQVPVVAYQPPEEEEGDSILEQSEMDQLDLAAREFANNFYASKTKKDNNKKPAKRGRKRKYSYES